MAFETAFLVGRILVGLYYIMSGYNHISKMKMMVEYSKSKNVPMPSLAVPFTGLLLLAGGLSLLLGVYPVIGITLLIIFLVPTTLIMHQFWKVPPEQKMGEMVNFLKNVALIGSTLMFLAIQTPWPFSVPLG